MRVLVTGGAGFIGSHAAEYFARQGHEVTVFDNLSRAKLLHRSDKNARFNWNLLQGMQNVRAVEGDVCDAQAVGGHVARADVIVHTAGQTAVTTSVTDPQPDFMINAVGTFNVLEAARRSESRKTILYTSTNKVYGDNVNLAGIAERATRYEFAPPHQGGITESFSVDLCKHTPYGCSKLTADLYMQEWARLYGHRVGVFRMSCIYGTRQFGFEDQGWVAWFIIAAINRLPITIFGDGKQVRDVLYVTDLVQLYDRFVQSGKDHGVYNTGGGPALTLSLLELLALLERRLGRQVPVKFDAWRPSDQKVYISDISRARRELGWEPAVGPEEGVDRLIAWTRDNPQLW